MATITALQASKRRRRRVEVLLDDGPAFSLALTLAAGLRVGQQLDLAAIERLQAEDQIARALDRAARFLARRPRSVAEVRRNLRQKGFADPAVAAALQRCSDRGWLDDLDFARFWVEDRLRFRPMGRRALAHGLRQKGVAPETIETALADLDGLDAARRAARDRLRRWRGLTRPELRRRLWAFLQRRGFESDLCRQVVQEILSEVGDAQAPIPDDMHEEYASWRP